MAHSGRSVVAIERLSRTTDSRIRYALDLLARLVALVPSPGIVCEKASGSAARVNPNATSPLSRSTACLRGGAAVTFDGVATGEVRSVACQERPDRT